MVPHHDDLAAACNRAESVFGPDLAGLVDQQQVELCRTRRQVLCDRDRAHQEDRLDPLHHLARRAHDLPDWLVTALLGHLAAQEPHLP